MFCFTFEYHLQYGWWLGLVGGSHFVSAIFLCLYLQFQNHTCCGRYHRHYAYNGHNRTLISDEKLFNLTGEYFYLNLL